MYLKIQGIEFGEEDEVEAEAQDRLLNANPSRGQGLGVGDPRTEDESLAWLVGHGLATERGNLTAKGAVIARAVQRAVWED